MHELPIIKSIFKTVTRKAESIDAESIRKVVIEVGILRDYVPEMMQKYWDYIAKDTIAEGAVLETREIQAMARCGRCGNDYIITKEHIADAHCPVCKYDRGQLIAGDELKIIGMEIVSKKKTDE